MKVFAYWNLHRKVWSLKAAEGPQRGRVVMHTQAVTLTQCELKVSQAGRERVLRERRKNVHAGVMGHLLGFYIPAIEGSDVRLRYNPYEAATFRRIDPIDGDAGEAYSERLVTLDPQGKAWAVSA